MPGYGPHRSSVSLRDLVRKETPEEVKARDLVREQDQRDADERTRTHAASKACNGQRSYLMLCDVYIARAGADLRAHRLVAARDAALIDQRAHIVPAGDDRDVRAICGIGPGKETGAWGWGRTLSQASCPDCILRTDSTRVGSAKPGTGERVSSRVSGYLYPRRVGKKPEALGWWD